MFPIDIESDPTIGALCATLEEVVPVIVRSVTHLALVLRNTDIGPEKFEPLIKEQADIFWETQPNQMPYWSGGGVEIPSTVYGLGGQLK